MKESVVLSKNFRQYVSFQGVTLWLTIDFVVTHVTRENHYAENNEYKNIHVSLRVRAYRVYCTLQCRFQGLLELRFCLNNNSDAVQLNVLVLSGYILHKVLIYLRDNFGMLGSNTALGACSELYHNGDRTKEPHVFIIAAHSGNMFREHVKETAVALKATRFRLRIMYFKNVSMFYRVNRLISKWLSSDCFSKYTKFGQDYRKNLYFSPLLPADSIGAYF